MKTDDTYLRALAAAGSALGGLLVGALLAWLWARRARQLFEQTGQPRPVLWPSLGLLLAGALAGWAIGGAPTDWNVPVPGDFAVQGGSSLTPEFLSVLIGLVLYTASYVAEVVRAGVHPVKVAANAGGTALETLARLQVALRSPPPWLARIMGVESATLAKFAAAIEDA